MKPTCAATVIFWIAATLYAGESPRAYPPKMDGCREETYKTIDGVKLAAFVFEPTRAADDKAPRPAIVFFFGGGWQHGSPAQFERHCRHFAARGIVAITADYRVSSRHKVNAAQCVADAKSCLRWVRANAERLGIDPKRIVAAGGSAGGHLAASAALLPGMDEKSDDLNVSCEPNALMLFNPALMLAPVEGIAPTGFAVKYTRERLGADAVELSPAHHIKAGSPPTLILHGRADTTVPFFTVEGFAILMKKAGNRCDLIGYDAQPHGFFNSAKYAETLAEADTFLVSLSYLAPAP